MDLHVFVEIELHTALLQAQIRPSLQHHFVQEIGRHVGDDLLPAVVAAIVLAKVHPLSILRLEPLVREVGCRWRTMQDCADLLERVLQVGVKLPHCLCPTRRHLLPRDQGTLLLDPAPDLLHPREELLPQHPQLIPAGQRFEEPPLFLLFLFLYRPRFHHDGLITALLTTDYFN